MSQEHDLTWREEPFIVGGVHYTLREASGEARVKYKNAAMNSVTLGEDGKTHRIDGAANVEPLLVSLCLFDENGKNVPRNVIMGWPGRIQSAAFDRIKKISDLDNEVSLDQLKKQREEIDALINKKEKEEELLKN